MRTVCLIAFLQSLILATSSHGADEAAARQALERAAGFLRSISTNGGYVGIYSLDLKKRYGEAVYEKAGATQIWVQPPGTPSVGEVFLRATVFSMGVLFLAISGCSRSITRAATKGYAANAGVVFHLEPAHGTLHEDSVGESQRRTREPSLHGD